MITINMTPRVVLAHVVDCLFDDGKCMNEVTNIDLLQFGTKVILRK